MADGFAKCFVFLILRNIFSIDVFYMAVFLFDFAVCATLARVSVPMAADGVSRPAI